MNRTDLQKLFRDTVRSPKASVIQYDTLAEAVVDVYVKDADFRKHIVNRSVRVTETTSQAFDAANFDIGMAQAFIADELGYPSWGSLLSVVESPAPNAYPILFQYAIAALRRGDFTALEEMVGGPEAFSETVIDWHRRGYFTNEVETVNEAFAAACMLGHERAAGYLLNKGVDPYAGMRTGLAGFHWAASSGRLEVVKLLIERKLPTEVQNMYEGTVLGQALWSARFEHTPDHAEIIELLIAAGAHLWPGTAEWWDAQEVPSAETKARVANALGNAG